MKVCIILAFYYPYRGGIEDQVYEMIKRLHKNGVEVKVLSLIPKEDMDRLKEFPYAECIPVGVKRIRIPKSYPPPFNLFSPFEVMKKFEKECSDIKLVHSFGELMGSIVYKKRKNNVFIHSQHNALRNGTGFFLWNYACNLATKQIYSGYFQNCKKVVCISRHMAEEMKKYCGVSENHIKVIPNGLNFDNYKCSKKDAEEFRERYDIDKFFVFATGRMVKEKGFQQLIKAVSEMENKDVFLGIGGEGYYKEDLIKLSKKLNINFKLFGFLPRSDLLKAFCTCDVFVTPSLFQEPFGLVNIEAMLFEKPVVASRIGGIPEIVDDNITGMLYEPNDYKELAKKLDILYSDDKLRLRLGKNGRKKVEMKYNWDILIKEWLKFYKSFT
jgi:glycosyltransferase involved in cell wall biosynthesis